LAAKVLHPQDLPTIVELSGFGDEGTLASITKAIHLARTRLVTLAQQRLKTSARDYVGAITPPDITSTPGGWRATILLTGAFAHMVEEGAAPWDLRTTILKPGTRKIRTSKAGFLYLSVPFRHMTPSASGVNAPPMGSAYSGEGQKPEHRAFRGSLAAAAAALGKAVHKAAKKLAPTLSAPGVGTQYGGRLAAGVGGATLLRPRHVTDVYQGMIREEKTYEDAKPQTQYLTFRTISNNPATRRSDDAGGQSEVNWTHPGLEARHLVPEALEYIHDLIRQGVFIGVV